MSDAFLSRSPRCEGALIVDYHVNKLEKILWTKNDERHARLPLFMRHNNFVRNTFERVQQQFDDLSTCLELFCWNDY
jgi:hypothetical protein